MKKALFCVSLCLCLLLAACEAEHAPLVMKADYPYYSSAQEAVDAASLVFSGTVQGWDYEELVLSEGGDPLPYTVYQVSVEKIYKGGWDDETVPVKVLGGELDGVSYVLEGAPTLRQGENYLFAVEVYPDSYPSLINLDQSVFEMDSGVAVNRCKTAPAGSPGGGCRIGLFTSPAP